MKPLVRFFVTLACTVTLTAGCSSTDGTQNTAKTNKKKVELSSGPIAGCETWQARKKRRCQR